MDKFKDFKKSGTFQLSETWSAPGNLTIDGGDTRPELFSEQPFTRDIPNDLLGRFYDLARVSLIDCVMLDGPNTDFKEKEKYHSCGIFPHIILVGHRHLKSDDACLTRLSFVVDDASTIFYDHEAFGTSFGTKELLIGDLDEAGKIVGRKLAR